MGDRRDGDGTETGETGGRRRETGDVRDGHSRQTDGDGRLEMTDGDERPELDGTELGGRTQTGRGRETRDTRDGDGDRDRRDGDGERVQTCDWIRSMLKFPDSSCNGRSRTTPFRPHAAVLSYTVLSGSNFQGRYA